MSKKLKIIVRDKRIKDNKRLSEIRSKAIIKYSKTKWMQDMRKSVGGVVFGVVSRHRNVIVEIK